jgi:molybdate transport system substrate-binding protein
MAVGSDHVSRIAGISSMATRLVLSELAQAWRAQSGREVAIESVGGVDALRRVQEGEAFDFVVLAADAIDKLAAAGRVDAASRIDVARSGVAIAVAAGAWRPDIGSEAAVRDAVLRARTIGYSTGPSGMHLTRLFQRWGIAEEIAPRIVQPPPGTAIGGLVARGEVELGFQQLSELLHVPGIDVVGPLPAAIQVLTVFCAAACTASKHATAAGGWLAYLASPVTDAIKLRYGMESAREPR